MSDRIIAGVVIDLPEPHATVVRNWRRRTGDPQADLVPPHVTLLPPTPLPRAELDRVTEHLSDVARGEEPFSMHLSGTGTFRPLSQVVYIQVSSGVGHCERLAAAIRRGPLDRPLDFPYHPHVTVAQDVDPAALDDVYEGLSDFVARFRADRFALFTRSARREWIVEHEFALGGPAPGGCMTVLGRVKAFGRAQLRRPWLAHVVRAYQQLNATNGSLLAAALTFFSFLAIIPMLLLAVSVTGFVLRSNPDLQRQLFDKIAAAAPSDLGKTMRSVVNTAIDNRTSLGLVALAGVALSGLGWINNLRLATEQVWEHSPPKRSFLKAKVADAGILAGLGVGLILSVGLTAAASALQHKVVHLLSLDGHAGLGLATTAFAIAIAVGADTIIFLFLVIRLPRSEVPRGVAVRGAVLAAVGFEVLKVFGSLYIKRVSQSPTAATFGGIIGVLVWLNLVFRFLLYCTAWTASATPDDLTSHSDPRGHLDPPVAVVAGPGGLIPVSTAARRPSRVVAVALMLVARVGRRPR